MKLDVIDVQRITPARFTTLLKSSDYAPACGWVIETASAEWLVADAKINYENSSFSDKYTQNPENQENSITSVNHSATSSFHAKLALLVINNLNPTNQDPITPLAKK
jgi:hypothetical protein